MTLTTDTAQEVTLRVGPLSKLPELITSLGHDPQPIFHQCGFQLKQFQDVENRLPFVQASKLIAHCVAVTGAGHLGLLLGQLASPSHLGLSGFLALTAPTVEEALNSVVTNLDLHEHGGIANLENGPSHSSFSYNLVLPQVAAAEQIYDLSAVMMYRILQTVCGDDWQADSISLQRRLPANTAPYQKFFDTQIYFNATECAVTFSNHWLQVTPSGSDHLLHRHLSDEARLLHESFKSELMEELPACLHKSLLAGQFSSKEVAARLGIHERTLHRRLKEADTSFRQELDQARCALSHRLLGSTSLPVCDVAAALGYSDSSGFIRAFQRWCGTSPSAWRRKRQNEENDKLAG